MPEYNINLEASTVQFRVQQFVNFYSGSVTTKDLTSVWIKKSDKNKFIEEILQLKNSVVEHLEERIFVESGNFIFHARIKPTGILDLTLVHGLSRVSSDTNDLPIIEALIEKYADNSKRLEIEWVVDVNGNSHTIYETIKQNTKDSLYPFIEGGMTRYINNFLESDSTILILIGEPGTGKTNFIRNIMLELNKKIYITYDEKVLGQDWIFAEFVASATAGAFVIEDADLLLRPRTEGNEIMSKLLNVGDGLIKLDGKKFIFSTNLPSTRDIDPAIMRPGRCYDVLKFRKLTATEANLVCVDYDLERVPSSDKEYTLTEVFNRRVIGSAGQKVGFY